MSKSEGKAQKPIKEKLLDEEKILKSEETADDADDKTNVNEINPDVEDLSIEEKCIQQEAKINELKDQVMRSLADGENLRKRTEKEIEHAKKYSHIVFVRDLVSSIDNLQRAIDSVSNDKDKLSEPIKNLILGLEIIEKEILNTFEKHNLKQIYPLGEKFDYNFHQAMFETPTNDKEPGIVVEVSQKGYTLHDRLVRPAMVGISKKPDETKKDKQKKEID